MEETGHGTGGNSLYYICNFFLHLKLFEKVNFILQKIIIYHKKIKVLKIIHVFSPPPHEAPFFPCRTLATDEL